MVRVVTVRRLRPAPIDRVRNLFESRMGSHGREQAELLIHRGPKVDVEGEIRANRTVIVVVMRDTR